MKIERPQFYFDPSLNANQWIDKFGAWFEEHVEPINKILSEGVEVYGNKHEDFKWQFFGKPQAVCDTHKALLINIQPIKKDTYEDIAKVFVNEYEGVHEGQSFGNPKLKALDEIYRRFKAVLNGN